MLVEPEPFVMWLHQFFLGPPLCFWNKELVRKVGEVTAWNPPSPAILPVLLNPGGPITSCSGQMVLKAAPLLWKMTCGNSEEKKSRGTKVSRPSPTPHLFMGPKQSTSNTSHHTWHPSQYSALVTTCLLNPKALYFFKKALFQSSINRAESMGAFYM